MSTELDRIILKIEKECPNIQTVDTIIAIWRFIINQDYKISLPENQIQIIYKQAKTYIQTCHNTIRKHKNSKFPSLEKFLSLISVITYQEKLHIQQILL